jgi:nicotinate-nucleotide adenylyltransferase
MRIGVFAGTFDPVHEGHLAFAQAAMIQAKLDKILFMPEPKPWRKQQVTDLHHRSAMLELATADEPRFSVLIPPVEQFTLASVMPYLTKKFAPAEFSILLGADALKYVPTWEKIDAYWDDIDFLVGRADRVQAAPGKKIRITTIHHPLLDRNSTDVRAGKTPTLAAISEYVKNIVIYH